MLMFYKMLHEFY